ncbi:MAG: peptide chain release factor 2 [Eubacteriales bacterium]|nr:peptide chain release factor 2 [Eubacteriales bacterium]
MLELEQLRDSLKSYTDKIKELGVSLDLAGLKKRIETLDVQMLDAGFWDDLDNAQKVNQELKALKTKVERMDKLTDDFEEIQIMIELGIEEGTLEMLTEIETKQKELEEELEALRVETLLNGEFDGGNAIVSLHAGAGGTESCDWVSMLYRMYSRWAENKGFQMEVLDYLDGEEAGIKSITFQINGENAYGYLQSEKGVHRLVRISPFDSSGRRHTSFASCDVMPDIEEDIDIEIKEEEMRVDTYRASGAGGQHINKTDSAIRITHIPTGIVVQCQNERSQHKNRERAIKMLKAKLYEIKEREHLEKIQDIRGEMKDIAWGSQIRSYVMHPYSLVKDHRTNEEIGNVDKVMDGYLDHFMNSYLIWKSTGEK